MFALTELTGWNVAYIRIGIEAFVLLAGWLLGGPVSFGTFLFCVTIGSMPAWCCRNAKRSQAACLDRPPALGRKG
ncbi:hypothetical protein AA906_13355 [Geobacillus stearothermophilus]|uniref:hypothetical protein n=1 Tax=Geobacillus stearothermophilus TaxID=1422 RepID=UPI00066FEC3E|nr:hypothetical protein [Geobacillus stearothermophilus]KMY57629.1 hypothetical protein AA906_13355 [Geobacillus stearothermophilus]